MKTRSGIQVVDSLASIPASDWDALAGHHPLLSHAFLHALQESGCVSAETGWAPCHITLWRDNPLAAGLPLYLKSHSYRGNVFARVLAVAYPPPVVRSFPHLVDAGSFTPGARPRP